MPTPTSNINEVEYGWGDFLRPLFDLFGRYGRRRAHRHLKPINVWADDPRLQEAISAVRMAAYPGEDYEDVAARIDREAARYREFLRNPTPIGKITLNTKVIDVNARVRDDARDKYQVCDPAGGRAAVFYSVERSPQLVLEFVVHDQSDAPLFPIVRTYSDWLGRKSFDLGAGRTFDLHMSEDECPAKVRVHARVATAGAASKADTECCFAGGMPSPATGADDKGDRAIAKGASGWSYGSRISLAFGVECLILFAFGWTFLRPAATPHSTTAAAPSEAVGTHASAPGGGGNTPRGEPTQLLVVDGESPLKWRAVSLEAAPDGSAGGGAQRKSDGTRRGFTRIAAVSRGHVKMDEGFCRIAGDSCNEWRASMQSALDAVNDLLIRRAGAPDDSTGSRPGAVLVSYPAAGADSGQMHVTLLLADEFFLFRGTDCMKLGGGAAKGLDEATFNAAVSDMCKGTESNEQPTGDDTTLTPEGRVKSLDAE